MKLPPARGTALLLLWAPALLTMLAALRTSWPDAARFTVVLLLAAIAALATRIAWRGTAPAVAPSPRASESEQHVEAPGPGQDWGDRFLRVWTEESSDVITVLDASGAVRYVSPSVQRIFGRPPERLLGVPALDLVHPEDRERVRGALRELLNKTGLRHALAHRVVRSDGSVLHLESVALSRADDAARTGVVVSTRDVTQRQVAEQALRESEDRLRQAQKMEAVGQLAGGVAHDFNNLLTVLGGHVAFALRCLTPDHPAHSHLGRAAAAIERGAALTRQLLAFARQQHLAPRTLELNTAVRGIVALLGRTLGDGIVVRTLTRPEAGWVRVDPVQLEQVVMNVALNARDAMPKGGQLTIETGEAEFDPHAQWSHVTAGAGRFALLSITDTGTGMDEQTQRQIFNPFFTTKEVGKGTGLGLATVYGIVKQSGGYIQVRSAPGSGTTFDIYLPQAPAEERAAQATAPVAAAAPEARGHETVLLAEDDEAIRELASAVLEEAGYRVLTAIDGVDALRAAREHDGRIDLLVTDVAMPNLGGRETADRLRAEVPGLAVLYISGYTGETLARQQVLEPDAHFLPKPFALDALLEMARTALDGRVVPTLPA